MIVEHGSGIWNQDQPLILISFFPYSTPSTLSLAIDQQCQPYQWLMLSHLSSTYHHHLSISSNGIPPARCPSHKGCGPIYIMLNGQQHGGNKELREDVERRVGSRGKWCVTTKKPWWKSWIIFAFFIYLPSKSLTSPPEPNDTTKPWGCSKPQWHHLLPLPPPSHSNTSQRWTFWFFQCLCHNHYLPHIQTQARGGPFWFFQCICNHHHLSHIQMWARGSFCICFNISAMMTTSLMSKRELEVVILVLSTFLLWPPPPSHPNTSCRWIFLTLSTHLPLPPPSCPKVSQR